MARRRLRGEETIQSGGMLTTYLCLMIILLSFFIMLVSMSRLEEKKKISVLESIYSSFGFLGEGSSPFFSPGGLSSRPTAPMTPLEADFREIKALVYRSLGEDKIQLLSEPGRRILAVDREILFDPDSVTLKPKAEAFLKGLAAIIERGNYKISVLGHTDDIPPAPGGPAADNWTLSGLRAVAVVKFLAAMKINPKRLAAYGYGPSAPILPNTSAENRAANNRVEIILDESAASEVDDLKVGQGAGRVEYKGFTFDLYGRP